MSNTQSATDILDLVRKNSSLVVDQQAHEPSVEESDVVINIDQAKDENGAPVDTAGLAEGALIEATDAKNSVDALTPAIDDAVNDTAALESNAALLKRYRENHGGIDQQAAAIVRTNIDNAVRRIGYNATTFNVPAVEAFGGTAASFESTQTTETTARKLAAARRIVAVENAIVQNDAIETMNDSLVEAAQGLAARAASLEPVVANITGTAPDANVEDSSLAAKIGSKNGSPATAAANLATYTTNVLVTASQQYNALGSAVAEVEETVGDAVPDAADPTASVDAEADLDATVEPTEVTADATPADSTPAVVDDVTASASEANAEPAEPETKEEPSTENVDQDTLVNESGKETTVAKPDDFDPVTGDTPKEAAEGTEVATDLPEKPKGALAASMENEDVDVADIADNISTDADLPGDATVDFPSKDEAESWVGEEGDLGAAAAEINAVDVEVVGGQHEGTSLPVLSQSDALLILRSVKDICQAVVQNEEITNRRSGILEGMHTQAQDVVAETTTEDASAALGGAVDFNLAILRTVAAAEREVAAHALNACRDLLTYVGLSCKAYTDAPAPALENDTTPSMTDEPAPGTASEDK